MCELVDFRVDGWIAETVGVLLLDRCVDGWMDGWMNGWIHRSID